MAYESKTSSSFDVGSAQALFPGYPTGATASTVLLWCVCGSMTDATVITPPSGWTLVQRKDQQNQSSAVYWALGNVASMSFTVNATGGMHVACLNFTGRSGATPISASDGIVYTGGGTLNAPSVTAAQDDDLYVMWHSKQGAAFGSVPAGLTDRVGLVVTTPADLALYIATKDAVNAGATGTWSRSCADYVNKTAVTVALKAGSAAPAVSSACVVCV